MAGYVLRERAAGGTKRAAGGARRAPAAVNLSLLASPGRALTLALACITSVVLSPCCSSRRCSCSRQARMPDAGTLFNIAERLSGSFGIALLATLYASRAAATGDPVTAFRDCALVLTVAAAVGAVAAACHHGVSVNDAG